MTPSHCQKFSFMRAAKDSFTPRFARASRLFRQLMGITTPRRRDHHRGDRRQQHHGQVNAQRAAGGSVDELPDVQGDPRPKHPTIALPAEAIDAEQHRRRRQQEQIIIEVEGHEQRHGDDCGGDEAVASLSVSRGASRRSRGGRSGEGGRTGGSRVRVRGVEVADVEALDQEPPEGLEGDMAVPYVAVLDLHVGDVLGQRRKEIAERCRARSRSVIVSENRAGDRDAQQRSGVRRAGSARRRRWRRAAACRRAARRRRRREALSARHSVTAPVSRSSEMQVFCP